MNTHVALDPFIPMLKFDVSKAILWWILVVRVLFEIDWMNQAYSMNLWFYTIYGECLQIFQLPIQRNLSNGIVILYGYLEREIKGKLEKKSG